MAEIKIDHNVPLPKYHYHKGRWKNLLLSMKVNDSFAVPPKSVPALRFTISQRKLRHPSEKMDWTVRKTGTDSYRCWRIK